MYKIIVFILLVPCLSYSQGTFELSLPQSVRCLGMGGAYVAAADDPEAGILNPAGICYQRQIGYDMSVTAITGGGSDHLVTAYCNPSSDSKTTFGTGAWTQGLTRTDKYIYYVPYVGTGWRITKTSSMGLVLRSPIIKPRHGSEKTKMAPVADVSILQRIDPVQVGALIERAVGGSVNLIPRRLRAGAALIASRNFSVVYEWWGDQTDKDYDFKYQSSHAGAEIVLGKYIALRGGYVWGKREDTSETRTDTTSMIEDRHISFGASVGLLQGGWQVGCAWEIPISEKGNTIWSAGASYRL